MTRMTVYLTGELIWHPAVKAVLFECIPVLPPPRCPFQEYAKRVLATLQHALEAAVLSRGESSTIHHHFEAQYQSNVPLSSSATISSPVSSLQDHQGDDHHHHHDDHHHHDGHDDATTTHSLEIRVNRCMRVMNNLHYIRNHLDHLDESNNIQPTLDSSIQHLANDHFIVLFTHNLTTHSAMPVSNEPVDLKKHKGASTSPFCRALKERFNFINEHLDTWSEHWLHQIEDETIRTAIQRKMISIVKKTFGPFWNKYGKVQFSKKNMSKYTRWSPERIIALLES